ncbi:hypothetical protein [Psychrobacter sp. LV10R520-6]|uniref:hypothetical protein n=1 Tax=Psychrobacter sp. LV10R520-6 TaxID=1415574 RepID=UPI0024CB5DBF|nr:hypothetical protein [Psychrobacter sp. LV10R520-6]SNT70341.1 hypothetical protein SAMN04488491_1500 [Psychrobacter sp. LV10R520-6]
MTDDKRIKSIKENSRVENSLAESSETQAQEDSIADSVEQHLLGLENSNNENLETSQIQEQGFSEAELSRLVNTEKLQSLLNQSDEFLGSLSSEVEDFNEDNHNQ